MELVQTGLLFHYTGASAAVESVLATGQLRLGLLQFTNDPRESRSWNFSASVAEGVDFGGEDFQALSQEADRLLRRRVKLVCFTQDDAPADPFDRMTGRGFAHSRLWAQYAENHAGVCLGFDRDELLRTLNDELASLGASFHGPVEYVVGANLPYDATHIDVEQVDEFGLDAVIDRTVARYSPELFLRKDLDWATEREYRWLLINDAPAPVYVDVASCIRIVVLGAGFPPSRLPTVTHLARELGDIEVAQLHYVTGRPQLLPALEISSNPPRPFRQNGTVTERAKALARAEQEAVAAFQEGEQRAAASLTAIGVAAQNCANQLARLDNVEVSLLPSGYAAVPLKDRQRAAGVARGDVIYSAGRLCVTENLPKQSVTLVSAIAVQVLTGERVRFHAKLESEQWLPDGNNVQELWRGGSAGPSDDAGDRARAIAAELEERLPDAISSFNSIRHAHSGDA